LKLKYSKINLILASIYLIVFFAFTAGLINALIEGQKYNVSQFLPSRSIQNNYETIIGIFILIFGFIGIVVMYKANDVNKRNEKYICLISGFIIFSLSVYFMYYLVSLKEG
jgi:formate hydrogenlyase subunit 3/multisubunit Na+/H+ antiporter MnhD subunit